MKKTYIWLIVMVVILIAAIVAWLNVDKAAKKKAAEAAAAGSNNTNTGNGSTAPQPAPTPPPTATTPLNNSLAGYPITMSHYAADAKLLQAALGVTADGIIGNQTLAAWAKYKNVNSTFVINNRQELEYYVYEVNEKKVNRTPKTWSQYFSSASNSGTGATSSPATAVSSAILAPGKAWLQAQANFWSSIFG
jgi:hypothetical protein